MASATQPLPFLIRLVSIDYYLARPAPKVDVSYAPLEGTAVDQVPVVRIFGSTPSGQKTCVHLHKVSHSCPRKVCFTYSEDDTHRLLTGLPLLLCPLRRQLSR